MSERGGRRPAPGTSAVAAGAARASGERARRRRRTTPLLADLDPSSAIAPDPAAHSPAAEATGVLGERARPKVTPPPGHRPPPDLAESDPPPDSPDDPQMQESMQDGEKPRRAASRQTSGGKRLVAVTEVAAEAGVALADAVASGAEAADLDERVVAVLSFLRRRLTGDYQVDEFGFDSELTDSVLLAVLRPLYRRWFRVEVRGIDNIPATGGALIVANHAGAIALDSVMVQVAVHDEHPAHRHLRPLGADLVFQTPVLGELARKAGATLATTVDAERLLGSGELVGVWPEGFKGIGKPFSERYKLQRFGRGGFVSAALRTRTPIVPCAIVGSEETYPILGNMPAVARLLGLPYAPITPTFPLLGLLGVIPLPSKWLIEFAPPVATDDFPENAADDPMLVFDLTDQVRQTIQQSLYQLLVQRQTAFF